jgi:hypothetical protein
MARRTCDPGLEAHPVTPTVKTWLKQPLDGFAAAYAAGAWLWLGGNLVLAAGLAGRLDRPALAALALAIAAGLAAIALRARPAWRAAAAAARSHPWLAALLLVTIALEAALGAAPPTARDALVHHLALARLFVSAGRIVDVPFAIHAAYPQGADMLYLLPVGLGADFAAAWIHLGFGCLAALVLAARARRWGGDRAGLLAAILFLGLPAAAGVASAAYVDLALCLYVVLACEAFLRWCEAGQRGGWLAGAGLSLGFALSVKYAALVAAFALGALVLLESLRHATLARAAARGLLLGVLLLAPAAPWLARNAALRHDPFYPLFPSVFGVEAVEGDDVPGPLAIRSVLYGESVPAIAALPIRILVSGAEGDPRRFDGRLNPFVAILAAGLLLAGGRGHPLRGAWAAGAFAAIGILFTLATAVARARYVLPYAGILCALAAAALPAFSGRRVIGPRLAGALIAAALAWNGFFLLRAAGEPAFTDWLAGREGRAGYLARRLPAYPVYEATNARVGAGDRVQLLFMGDQGYYLDAPYTFESYFSGRGLARALPGGPHAIEGYFRRAGVTHLLVNRALLRNFLSGLSMPRAAAVWETFRRARLTLLEESGPFALYVLREAPVNQGLASGPGFKIAGGPADNR